MSTGQQDVPTTAKPLRLWPGVLGVAMQLVGWFASPYLAPESGFHVFMGGLFGGALLVVVWWLLLSRAPWLERLVGLVLVPLVVAATTRVVHPSIEGGMMGMMLPIYSILPVSMALVAWAAAARRLPTGLRRPALVAAIVVAIGAFALLRTDGVRGSGGAELRWRWSPTAEERLLARAAEPIAQPTAEPTAAAAGVTGAQSAATAASPAASPSPATAAAPSGAPAEPAAKPATASTAPAAPAPDTPAEWPGFRGPERDGVVHGVSVATDWSHSPPVELWRRRIGPGWSSFAVDGNRVYTQEQRGEDEDVSCYDLATGEPVWRHRDKARFWESNAGPGPRATPTLAGGRVYSFGATGILNALDATTGAVLWSRDAKADTGAKTPGWGFSGSPLVTGELVLVAASGRLAAYEAGTGELRWKQERGGSYSSPQLMTIDGVPQVLLMTSKGLTAFAPADGAVLWEHAWSGEPILQPALTADGDLLISTGGMSGSEGIRRVAVAQESGRWTATERWTSRALKPYFNDFVAHEGHAYGFDGSILACIDLADGQRKWKGGRYGNGQLVLLAEQDLLLVLSEDGELALVRASPDAFAEVAQVPAIQGKTWNHPALAGDVLLVRNGEEMAAFRLARAGDPAARSRETTAVSSPAVASR